MPPSRSSAPSPPLRKKKLSYKTLLQGGVVTIYVGPDKKPFHAHKALLCARSTYFRSAFRTGFQESYSDSITFADVSVPAFALFMLWLYQQEMCDWDEPSSQDDPEEQQQQQPIWTAPPTGTVPGSRKKRGESKNSDHGSDDASTTTTQAIDIINLYLFADLLSLSALKNESIRLLDRRINSLSHAEYSLSPGALPLQHLNYVWQNTTNKSPLRRYLIDTCVDGLSPEDFADRHAFPASKEVLVALLRGYAMAYEGGYSACTGVYGGVGTMYDEVVEEGGSRGEEGGGAVAVQKNKKKDAAGEEDWDEMGAEKEDHEENYREESSYGSEEEESYGDV